MEIKNFGHWNRIARVALIYILQFPFSNWISSFGICHPRELTFCGSILYVTRTSPGLRYG